MLAKIVPLCQPYSPLVYSLPEVFPRTFWRTGLRVAMPLAKLGLRAGYVAETADAYPLPAGVKCRSVCWPLETEPALDAALVALAADIALRQGIPTGYILAHVLPPGLRSTQIRLKLWHDDHAEEFTLARIATLDDAALAGLAEALLAGRAVIARPKADIASRELCVLRVDPPWPIRPAAVRQAEILDYLHGRGKPSRRMLLKALGADRQKSLESLIKAGCVAIELDENDDFARPELLPPPEPAFELNDCQRKAVADFISALATDKAEYRLLYGITGSGKTAVYLETARSCLKMGKSVFLLAPEVALAYKLHRDAVAALGDYPVYLYHGYQRAGAREAAFRAIATGGVCVVAGTRSALFLPAPNPGLFILDEEHDSSFKQDEIFAYSAKEAAWFRATSNNGLLILGSATPDIKTFYAASEGRLPIIRLDTRANGKPLPPAKFVDIGVSRVLATSLGSTVQSPLAEESEEALRECALAGEQAVILLNRRGYAPMLHCVNCAKTLRCPNCEISLAFHKSVNKLVCHYCGYSLAYPAPCPDCGKANFLAIGDGTEKLAERLEILAGQPILRLDRDSVGRPGKMEEILASFARREAPFLVGTQMISKGHHFPNVTLVVVADGDIGLNLPDYRAAEKTFQILTQAAGRAGRGEKAGRVLIQTRNPNHYCWHYVQNHDYEGFYAEELARRKKKLYPPFTRLALLRISFPLQDDLGMAAVNELGAAIKKTARELGVTALGPAPAPMALLRGRKRFQCLFKSDRWPPIRQIYFTALKLKCANRLRLFLDIDPVNMM